MNNIRLNDERQYTSKDANSDVAKLWDECADIMRIAKNREEYDTYNFMLYIQRWLSSLHSAVMMHAMFEMSVDNFNDEIDRMMYLSDLVMAKSQIDTIISLGNNYFKEAEEHIESLDLLKVMHNINRGIIEISEKYDTQYKFVDPMEELED